MLQRVFSGIQPTHHLHLGNYLGAIRQWVPLQHSHECLFCIVDLHAITVPQDPQHLRRCVLETAACYLACGIDPDRSTVFVQSTVPFHTELAWILGCQTPMGWLNRMTQFKEKSATFKQQAGLGLYAYPVLMAADILLYQATHVPVGEDQKQHLELARDIALAFNHHYQVSTLVPPTPLILEQGARVMSLKNGLEKMSKSHPNEASRIHLNDLPDVIRYKIQKAKTDGDLLPGSPQDLEHRPEAHNLLGILASLQNQPLGEVCSAYEGQSFSRLKMDLSDMLVQILEPIRQRREDLLNHLDYLDHVLQQGTHKALDLARPNMAHLRQQVGLVSLQEDTPA